MSGFSAYLAVFGMAMVKFLFASSFAVATTHLSFFQIFLTTAIGSVFSFSLFYLLSGFFMSLAKNRRDQKIKNGTYQKKHFSRTNKTIVKIKRSTLGYFILLIIGPLFLSVPLGAIVLAKFYRHLRITYIFEVANLTFWSFVLTLISELWR